MSPQDIQLLFYELRLHQIELEMQNEAIRDARDELDAAHIHIMGLYDSAPIGCCTLSKDGLILEANVTFARILGVVREEIIAKPFASYVINGHQDAWYFICRQCLASDDLETCELHMQDSQLTPFLAKLWVNVSRRTGESMQFHLACAVPSDLVRSVDRNV